MRSAHIKTFNDTEGFLKFQEVVTCPCCQRQSVPKFLTGHLDTFSQATMFFYCRLCQNSFASVINEEIELASSYGNIKPGVEYYFSGSFPTKLEEVIVPDEISKLSTDFVEIFQQAKIADQLNNLRVAGPGYRKALEFLIKDYAISQNEEEEAIVQIKRMPLSQCIEQYIDHPRIKSIVKRAAWLGNDETHYERKYSDFDIETFKTLIDLSMSWIALDLQSKELENAIVHHSELEN